MLEAGTQILILDFKFCDFFYYSYATVTSIIIRIWALLEKISYRWQDLSSQSNLQTWK